MVLLKSNRIYVSLRIFISKKNENTFHRFKKSILLPKFPKRTRNSKRLRESLHSNF
ncbi:hypothetical protein LEP1GSC060_0799 [Leptospira weilii serovar Ranarum str. ICFT]|uniref:Uncharacterized protein n=1 Tax=Leptospira weilii serovar Ranarum str. ICFT TaxID=1218598 RepID=N1WSV9_9LEPT|nr:hypothetical protein LEP1GSC060_0799 [Leptospira weilii serovar Ranarum str. ICFT]